MKPKQEKRSVDLKSMSVEEFMKSGLRESDGSSEEEDEDMSEYSDNYEDEEDGEEDQSKEYLSDPQGTDDTGQAEMKEEEGEENENAKDEEKGHAEDEEGSGDEEDSDDEEGSGDEEDSDDEEGSSDDEGAWTSKNFSHKRALMKLKYTDPEFFKYLQESEKELLEFDDSGSEDEKGEEVHKPPEALEVGSDESDFEGEGQVKEEEDTGGVRVITLKMVKEWEEQLKKSSRNVAAIKDVTQAFRAVLARVSSEEDEGARYKITGSPVFNAVIQLCVLEFQPALKRFLKMHTPQIPPTKHRVNWAMVNQNVKFYLNNLVKLLGAVQSPEILAVMLKHLHQMIPFASCFPVLRQPLLKMLIKLWSSSEDTVRIISFLCIFKMTTLQQDKLLSKVLKMMYFSFVCNTKFVSPSTLSAINFMRRSLVELFLLDLDVAYQHMFLYIRQLGIHLRNAITVPKKETIQAVYSWQFVNSARLWAEVLQGAAGKEQLKPLLYPLLQVVIATIQLIPTAQYFPLRFHCTQILINISRGTRAFVPVLPFHLDILNVFNFNKTHTKVSMKPMDFTCVLRVSKAQMQENGFRDAVIDHIYKQMLEYLTDESCNIAFPDIVIPAVFQLKKFLRTCKVSNYCRKMKQALDKIQENARYVERERSKVTFNLRDSKAIAAWESQLQMMGSPLLTFYSTWSEIHKVKEAKKQTENDKLGDFNLPVLKKRPREVKTGDEGPVELFPSDDDDDKDDDLNLENSDDDDEEEEEPPKKRGKRGGKGVRKSPVKKTKTIAEDTEDIEDSGDIVEDLTLESLQEV